MRWLSFRFKRLAAAGSTCARRACAGQPSSRASASMRARTCGSADGKFGQPFPQCLCVQHRSADQQRQLAALANLSNRHSCVAHKVGSRIGFGRITDIDQVVRNCARSAVLGFAVPMSMPR